MKNGLEFIKDLDKEIFTIWYDIESRKQIPVEIYFKLPTSYIFSFYISYNENSLNLYDENNMYLEAYKMPQNITEFMKIYDKIMNKN